MSPTPPDLTFPEPPSSRRPNEAVLRSERQIIKSSNQVLVLSCLARCITQLTKMVAPAPSTQRPRASSPAPKKDIIDVDSLKSDLKEKKSVTKEDASTQQPKIGFAKRMWATNRRLVSCFAAFIVAMIVVSVGAYFGADLRAVIGNVQPESIKATLPILAVAVGGPCLSALLCKKFLKRSIKTN